MVSIVPKSHVQHHLVYINSLNNDFQLTVETEQNSELQLLDLLISRNPSGNLFFAVYHKPTNTNNYLKFQSNHPTALKRAVAMSSVDSSCDVFVDSSCDVFGCQRWLTELETYAVKINSTN